MIYIICLIALSAVAGDILVVGTKMVTVPSDKTENAVPIETFGYNEWINYGGGLQQTTNGTGMNDYKYTSGWPTEYITKPDMWPTNNAEQWYVTSPNNSYRDEWQGRPMLTNGTNGKVAWMIADLGTSVPLSEWYLWNVREAGARGVQTFNVYYAMTPSVAPIHGPTDQNTSIDYNFASGGWTKLNTDGVLLMSMAGSTTTNVDAIVDFGGVRARYIGMEVITGWGDATRCGIAEQGATKFVFSKGVTP